MTYRIICDYETASARDLKTCGAAVYAEHWSTEILCLVWRRERGNAFGVWCPWLDEYRDLTELRRLAEDPEAIFVSHAMFEQFIWRFIMVPVLGMPPLPPERWEDTQATAAYKSLPLALEKLLKVLGRPTQKDMEGSRLTIGLSRPKKDGSYDRTTATLGRVVEYCKTDVAGEEDALHALGDVSAGERKVWLLDQEINHRGVKIDLEFVRAAQQVVDRATVPLLTEFRDLTSGINPTQRDKVVEWCKGQGVELESLRKDYLAELLGSDEDGEDDAGYESLADEELVASDLSGFGGASGGLPTPVRRVLEIRQMLGSASIKKLARMQACVGSDGRARSLLQYHAAHPGRWGGRLIQPQNFPKGGIVGADGGKVDYIDAILSGDPNSCRFHKKMLDGSLAAIEAIETVSMSLPSALVAEEGYVYEVGDYSGIEARIVLALAGQHDKTALIAAGLDAYLSFACDMFHVPQGTYTKDDKAARQKGKGGVLGCGFQCGYDSFNYKFLGGKPGQITAFGQILNRDFGDPDTAILTVNTYRQQWAPKVVELWNALKWAVKECVAHGRTITVYGCTLRIVGDFMAIDLPSGWQTVWYYQPAMRPRETARGVEYQPSYKAMKSGKWITVFLYGGILCENIVQALARGILVEAMGRLNYREQKQIVLSVHDEAVCEVPEDKADLPRFISAMEERSPWIERMGVPIAVEAWTGSRYKK